MGLVKMRSENCKSNRPDIPEAAWGLVQAGTGSLSFTSPIPQQGGCHSVLYQQQSQADFKSYLAALYGPVQSSA